MSTPSLLTVDNLAVVFATAGAPVTALSGVSFSVGQGEVLGIVGESGSGKTVACRSLVRLLSPNAQVLSGRIEFEGRDILRMGEKELVRIRGERIAMIFQNPSTHLDPLMTVGRQVGEALRVHHGLNAAEARREAIALLADMRIADPERRVDSYAHQLSGGMRQRVMIASALACRPALLLADEPTSALDVTIQAQILDLLRRLRKERGLSIVLVSHDLGVIAEMCDRVVVMKSGEVVESGLVREVVARPHQAYTRQLIASQPALMPPAASAASGREPILVLENVSVHFAQSRGVTAMLAHQPRHTVRAADSVSLTLNRGETLGIVGESGSGKSTLARAIVGLVPINSGTILFEGRSANDLRGAARVGFQRAVQMVFQDPFTSLNPAFTVEQTLAEPLRRHRMCQPNELPAHIAALMSKVELPEDLLGRRSGQLSGGQRQRVGIARALALEPKLIIADEVTSALDVTIQAQILGLFRKLRELMDLSLIVISHDLAIVRHLCERVAVMRHGRVVEYGRTTEIFAAPREAYTRELLAAIPHLVETRIEHMMKSEA
jgi:peptide/nickel transport system ATP-binding protein